MKPHGAASFIIYKASITDDQLNMILHYNEFIKELIMKNMLEGDHAVSPGTDFPMTPFGYLDDTWEVEDMGNRLYGSTTLDTFDMAAYLKHIGLKDGAVIWRDY